MKLSKWKIALYSFLVGSIISATYIVPSDRKGSCLSSRAIASQVDKIDKDKIISEQEKELEDLRAEQCEQSQQLLSLKKQIESFEKEEHQVSKVVRVLEKESKKKNLSDEDQKQMNTLLLRFKLFAALELGPSNIMMPQIGHNPLSDPRLEVPYPMMPPLFQSSPYPSRYNPYSFSNFNYESSTWNTRWSRIPAGFAPAPPAQSPYRF